MDLVKTIQEALNTYRDKVVLFLQGLTVLAMLMTLALLIRPGPVTLFAFMTVAQGLIVLSIVICTFILLVQKKAVQEEQYGPGQVIFKKGDKGDSIYLIIHGEVEILDVEPGKPEKVIGKLGAGECFGELELITNSPRLATIRSRTGVTLKSLDRESFDAMFAHLPPLKKLFEDLVEERARSQKKARES